jgi:hypothetical protein
MNYRCLAASVTIAASTALGGVHLAGQSAAKAPARTPWGHPDLQGSWSNDTFTPLQRPASLAAKEFFTPEEAARLNKALTADGVDPLAGNILAALLDERGDNDQLEQSRENIHYDNALWLTEKNRKGLASLRTSLIFDPPSGRIPPLTPEAQKRESARAAALKGHQFDDPESRTMAERCIIWPHEGPPLVPAPYNANLEILQTPNFVIIVQEIVHNARIIPLDGRPHIPTTIHQLSGDSRGHWEGETLVVDSTNFTARTRFQNSTETLHVTERFTRTDADTIDYRFTVEDPSTWTRPWSAAIPMLRTGNRLFEYACAEGNHDLENLLRVGRSQEKDAAAALKK